MCEKFKPAENEKVEVFAIIQYGRKVVGPSDAKELDHRQMFFFRGGEAEEV